LPRPQAEDGFGGFGPSRAHEAAQAQEAQAEINLKRTQVTAPVNGFVTNLQMRVGDFAHEGTSDVSVIDADSFWVDGYFEETKMARVCVGDAAEARLMGYPEPLLGRVQSVTGPSSWCRKRRCSSARSRAIADCVRSATLRTKAISCAFQAWGRSWWTKRCWIIWKKP
jgi:hypothetical protein